MRPAVRGHVARCENDLPEANMDFEECTCAFDDDGAFRGFEPLAARRRSGGECEGASASAGAYLAADAARSLRWAASTSGWTVGCGRLLPGRKRMGGPAGAPTSGRWQWDRRPLPGAVSSSATAELTARLWSDGQRERLSMWPLRWRAD
ncbi:hypothetical protein [Streptomyces chartreusis]